MNRSVYRVFTFVCYLQTYVLELAIYHFIVWVHKF